MMKINKFISGSLGLMAGMMLFSCSNDDSLDSEVNVDVVDLKASVNKKAFNDHEDFANYVDYLQKNQANIEQINQALAYKSLYSSQLEQLKQSNERPQNSKLANVPEFFISDPILSSILNENFEFQIGDEVYKVTEHYTLSYDHLQSPPNVERINNQIEKGQIKAKHGERIMIEEGVSVLFPKKRKEASFQQQQSENDRGTLIIGDYLTLQWVEDFQFFEENVAELGGDLYNHVLQGKIVYINVLDIYESFTVESVFRYKHPTWTWYGDPRTWPLAYWDTYLGADWEADFTISGTPSSITGSYGYPYGSNVVSPLWIKVVVPLEWDWSDPFNPVLVNSIDIVTYYAETGAPIQITAQGGVGNIVMDSGYVEHNVTTTNGNSYTVINEYY